MKKLVVAAVAIALAALGLVAGALAGGGYGGYGDTTAAESTASGSSVSTAGAETYSFTATLNRAQEVPKPKAPAAAGGTFTGKSTETKSATTFNWVLKFHGLSGKALAAHVHLGKNGKAGPVAIPLCGPCKNGQSGTVKISSSVESALEKGGAYVNIHTGKNQAGEIRGQVKLTGK